MKLDKRNKLVDELVEDLESWEYSDLLQFAQGLEREKLDSLSPKDLQFEWDCRFGDKPQ